MGTICSTPSKSYIESPTKTVHDSKLEASAHQQGASNVDTKKKENLVSGHNAVTSAPESPPFTTQNSNSTTNRPADLPALIVPLPIGIKQLDVISSVSTVVAHSSHSQSPSSHGAADTPTLASSTQPSDILRSFVPNTNLIARKSPSWIHMSDAAVLMIDISGFTKLSVALQQENPKTASERLNSYVSDYFERIVKLVVEEHGGVCEQFVGDAVIVLFLPEEMERDTRETPLEKNYTSLELFGDSTDNLMPLKEESLDQSQNASATLTMPQDASSIRRSLCMRAIQCAAHVQKEQGVFELPTGNAQLTLHTAVGIGWCNINTVRGESSTSHRFVTSSAFEQLQTSLPLSNRMDVIVGEEIRKLVEGGCEFELCEEEHPKDFNSLQCKHYRLVNVLTPMDSKSFAEKHQSFLEQIPQVLIRQHISPLVQTRIDAGQTQFLAELREAGIMFIKYNCLGAYHDNCDPHWEFFSKLQHCFNAVQEILMRSGGRIENTVCDEKGAIIVVAFTSFEDVESRAVHCALRLQTLARNSNKSFRLDIGISSGRIFLGPVGGSLRRSVTTIGKDVNLAARLLAHAQGSIAVSGSVHKKTRDLFNYEELGQVDMKGFDHTTSVFQPHSVKVGLILAPVDPDGAVCFERETIELRSVWDNFQSKDDFFESISIIGQAGIGKTELVKRFLFMTSASGSSQSPAPRIIILRASSVERDNPYHLLQDLILRHITNLDKRNMEDRKLHLIKVIPQSQHAFLDLFNPVMHVDFERTELSTDLSKSNMLKKWNGLFMEYMLLPWITGTRTVIVIEDLQWADEASLSFITFLQNANVSNLLLMLTLRHQHEVSEKPDDENKSAESSELKVSLSCNHVLTPKPFSPDDTERFIMRHFVEHHITIVDSKLLKKVVERSQGVAFIISEMLAMFWQMGAIAVTSNLLEFNKLKQVDVDGLFSSNIVKMLSAKIDNLQPDSNLLLKIASVIAIASPAFDEHLIVSMMPRHIQESVPHLLDEMVKNKFFVHFQTQLSFTSEPLQTATYELIPTQQRRDLHRKLALLLEKKKATSEDTVDVALHFSESLHDQESDTKLLGRVAKYLQRSVALLRMRRDVKRAHKLQTTLIDVLEKMKANELASASEVAQARLDASHILQDFIASGSDEVTKQLQVALDWCPQDATDVRFSLLEEMWFQLYVGKRDWDEWWKLVDEMLNIANQTQKPLHVLEANKCACVSLFSSSKYEDMNEYIARALQAYSLDPESLHHIVAHELNKPDSAVQCAVFGARANWFLGRCADARPLFDKGLEAFQRISHPLSRSMFLIFGSYYLCLIGDWDELLSCSTAAFELSTQQEYLVYTQIARCYRGFARVMTGDTGGIDELQEALELHEKYATPTQLLPLMLVWALVDRGDPSDLQLAESLVQKSLDSDQTNFDAELWRLKAQVEHKLWLADDRDTGETAASEMDLYKSLWAHLEQALSVSRSSSVLLELRVLLSMHDLCVEILEKGAAETEFWQLQQETSHSALQRIRNRIFISEESLNGGVLPQNAKPKVYPHEVSRLVSFVASSQ
mmetsp:Transcript_6310/g.23774  ORF Transcript_6310/g.23774 Transcript_6310/m.23774 type:complete len:1545 (-) Transcript_6310:3582-8216(-)